MSRFMIVHEPAHNKGVLSCLGKAPPPICDITKGSAPLSGPCGRPLGGTDVITALNVLFFFLKGKKEGLINHVGLLL